MRPAASLPTKFAAPPAAGGFACPCPLHGMDEAMKRTTPRGLAAVSRLCAQKIPVTVVGSVTGKRQGARRILGDRSRPLGGECGKGKSTEGSKPRIVRPGIPRQAFTHVVHACAIRRSRGPSTRRPLLRTSVQFPLVPVVTPLLVVSLAVLGGSRGSSTNRDLTPAVLAGVSQGKNQNQRAVPRPSFQLHPMLLPQLRHL